MVATDCSAELLDNGIDLIVSDDERRRQSNSITVASIGAAGARDHEQPILKCRLCDRLGNPPCPWKRPLGGFVFDEFDSPEHAKSSHFTDVRVPHQRH